MTARGVRRAAAVLAVGVLGVLGGCAGDVTGSAVPEPEEQPLTVASFGDLRTLDPCGLARPAAFAAHGQARPLPRRSFDECLVAVTIGQDNVEVEYGLLRQLAALPDQGREIGTLSRGVRVLETASDERSCERHLVLADDIAISVFAQRQEPDAEVSAEQICAVAKAGVDAIFETVQAGSAPHWDPPHNSLARLSACSALPTDEVLGLLGRASAEEVTLFPAEHQCIWGLPGGETPNAQLDFVVSAEQGATDDAAVERIAGRSTTVDPTGTDTLRVCTIRTEHIEFSQAIEGEREYAVVRTLFPAETGTDPCEVGRKLAELAWPALPPR
ncbi:hypothetical protein [Amycolatopsis aidingensis]|uniref:hypothetical protein n=1 Tax=Amycolatopsis aidingensis TaxID=2842453 RepID=UPI001C0D4E06|nr:hypothetical protein [Amycolatopsis aidingensis]